MDAEAGREKIILVKNFLNISNIIIFFFISLLCYLFFSAYFCFFVYFLVFFLINIYIC